MYWPTGAPSIYEQSLQGRVIQTSHDGLERHPAGGQHGGELISGLSDNNGPHNEEATEHEVAGSGVGEQDFRQKEQELEKGRYEAQRQQDREPTRHQGFSSSQFNDTIVSISSSRSGHIFATITHCALVIWSSRPTVILSAITRSGSSIDAYGTNVSLLMRPDAAILVIQTSRGFLITYSLSTKPGTSVYQLAIVDNGRRQARRRSATHAGRNHGKDRTSILDDGLPIGETLPRFRIVIDISAGISKTLALDNELVVATEQPAAIQCIRWAPDQAGNLTSTALLSKMAWLPPKSTLRDIVYDKPMNLFTWVMSDGCAYAVQRSSTSAKDLGDGRATFYGHRFHEPQDQTQNGEKASINSRFSLIALGCADGSIHLYSVKDYSGGISLLRHLQCPVSVSSCGKITSLRFSPDGYYLFVGYEKGWSTWTVLGLQGASSFEHDVDATQGQSTDTEWLRGVLDSFWIGGGSDLVLVSPKSHCLSVLEFARSSLTGNLSSANIAKPLLQTSSGIMLFQGHNTPDLTTISADVSLWHQSQVPTNYLDEQWPIRTSVISSDGRYVAVAGQRGLAHYSVNSGRWKVFDNVEMQNAFRVRGGMCWHQHILIAAVETDTSYEVRLYSREAALDDSKVLQSIGLDAPAVHIATSGDDSILIYTYENILDHYIVITAKKSVRLVKVGHIGLHGIIRAPARVRAVSWIIPEHQLQSGDPSKDVAVASLLLLVDGKLVLLQPTTSDAGELKYDMRVIAHNVEFYFLARDAPSVSRRTLTDGNTETGEAEEHPSDDHDDSLQDSLWLFDGRDIRTWIDVQSLLESAPAEYGREIPSSIATPVDFYPLSVLVHRGIAFGVEAESIRGRENSFTLFRTIARTSLFIPDILRYQLARYDSPGALHLSHHYQKLPYFAHALEVLLHRVLDDEVENPPQSDDSLLPTVLSFLSSFPDYLDVVVQCTRKTELRSWDTLFSHLPPPQELFEASLEKGALKTASGYLLVLHTLADIHSTSPQVIRLLRAAKESHDWELCKELARFLMALDESGATLEYALDLVDLASPTQNRSHDKSISDSNGTSEALRP